MAYVHLNELYTRLPAQKKRDYFKRIVKIHHELEKYHAEEKNKRDNKTQK